MDAPLISQQEKVGAQLINRGELEVVRLTSLAAKVDVQSISQKGIVQLTNQEVVVVARLINLREKAVAQSISQKEPAVALLISLQVKVDVL